MPVFIRRPLDPAHVDLIVRAFQALDVTTWEARCAADPNTVPPPDVVQLHRLARDYRDGVTGHGQPRRLSLRDTRICARAIALHDSDWLRELLAREGFTLRPDLRMKRRWVWVACAEDPTAALVGRSHFYEMLYSLGVGRFPRADGWYLSGIGVA